MELSDPDASRAVLIGVHKYDQMPDLPAVKNNLTDLKQALTTPDIWGLSPDNCVVVDQPGNVRELLNAVQEAGRQAKDTLLVYYAGHGLIDAHSDDLYLTLTDTDPEFTASAMGYKFLRLAVRDPQVRAARKVVILDCCYSGRAAEGGMGDVLSGRTVTAGTHVLTASGPTERAWSPPGEAHTAFTGELIKVFDEGIADGPELLTMDAIYQHVHAQLLGKDRPLPHQQNNNAGGDIVLVRNRAVASAPRVPLALSPPPPRKPWWSWRPEAKFRGRGKLALVVAVTLAAIVGTALVVDRRLDVARVKEGTVPAALADCRVGGPVPEGATTAYTCQDWGQRPAVVEVYPDRKTLDLAYERTVGDADVPPSTGDCGNDEDAEHRYPVTGVPKGRVLCFTVDKTTTVLWTDNDTHTIARVEAPAEGVRALRESWASITAVAPEFPTADEDWLVKLPVASDCARAGVEEMDDFDGAVAGVTCAGTGGAGAQSVTYFRFDSTPKLTKTMGEHIPAGKDPKGAGCADGEAPKFTGGSRYDVHGVFLGVLLCYPGPGGDLVIEWSVDALNVAARAVGSGATELATWWRSYRGPPLEKIVEAVNDPGHDNFPDAAESALLKRIPKASRRLCMRASGEYRTDHVHTYPVTAGVVCGPTSSPAIVFYYQFTDKKSLADNYGRLGSPAGSCTASPTSDTGEGRYSRGGATGRVRCEVRENNNLARTWTDERRLIQGFAFQGHDARAMTDWWEHDAGPL